MATELNTTDFIPVESITKEIIQQYKEDDKPWIIGFSGGKDSTTLLQLVFYALQQLPKEDLHKEIHVLCKDLISEDDLKQKTSDDYPVYMQIVDRL